MIPPNKEILYKSLPCHLHLYEDPDTEMPGFRLGPYQPSSPDTRGRRDAGVQCSNFGKCKQAGLEVDLYSEQRN
jgi:hypothetical protein